MGLSSKLASAQQQTSGAASQQQQNPYGAPQQQQNPYGAPPQQQQQQNPYGAPQQQQNPYGAPPQQQQNPYGAPQPQQNPYGAPQQQNPYGAPQPQQNPYGTPQPQQNPYGTLQQQQNPYGAPQPQYNSPYGAPQQPPPPYGSSPVPGSPSQQQHFGTMQGANDMSLLSNKLNTIIFQNNLQGFYDQTRLQSVLQKLSTVNFDQISQQWRIPKELTYDLAILSLYDIVLYCDDSGSMAFEDKGERIDDLKFILSKISDIITMFDDDGILVRFMNSNVNGDGIRNSSDVQQLISKVHFSGMTPLGTNLDKKVLQPFVVGQATRNQMAKPVLVIVITDGEPSGESKDTLAQVIRGAKDVLMRTRYGANAFGLSIAQVGKDSATQKFLEKLDNDPMVGDVIDCTSYYEMEEMEWAAKGVSLTPEMWLLKVCLGAIDKSYDDKD